MGVPSFMRRRGEVPPCAVLAGRVTTGKVITRHSRIVIWGTPSRGRVADRFSQSLLKPILVIQLGMTVARRNLRCTHGGA